MFNIVEKHQKLVKGIMVAITATFVVWGIGGYLGMTGDDGYIAKVGGSKIYQRDIDQAMEQQGSSQDQQQVLYSLVSRQLLLNSLQDQHVVATVDQLRDAIALIPIFQTNGKFDVTKYQEFLKQRYTTSAKFEHNMQQQIVLDEMVDMFKNSYFTSKTFQDKFISLLSRQRNVTSYVIDPKQFYGQINPDESAIQAFYVQNIATFTTPEQAKFQYLTLSADNLAKSIKVSDSEINQYMQDHADLVNNQQIDVSHILFTVPADATPEQKAKIKAQAEKILAEVKANPSKFASLAKEYSQDPGSAANGGDLGFFGRGVMVKPFESAAFALHQGEISNLVETQYGFHILKMNAFKGGDEASKRQLAREQVQKQKAQQQLSSVVDQLNDITYNKSDSLEPAAKQLGLTLQTTPNWVSKTTAQDVFANPKVQKVMFSADVVKQHHNSEVIDLGDGSYVVLRALDYQASLQKPLATIKAQVIEMMKSQQASQMAALQGQQQLAQLQQGKLKLNFTNAESVTLLGGNKAIDQAAVKQIFAVAAESFPSYTGSPTQDGKFVIYQINSQRVDKSLLEQNQKLLQQMSDQYAMISLNAYLSALQSKYKISYRADRLANNNAQGAGSN